MAPDSRQLLLLNSLIQLILGHHQLTSEPLVVEKLSDERWKHSIVDEVVSATALLLDLVYSGDQSHALLDDLSAGLTDDFYR